MIKPLVSVLSPCYNVGPYIDRFIDSLIAQTYKNLEIIFVNDGTTDNTLEIIQRRSPEMKSEGYDVKIVSQENGGVASAINLGLKHFTGDYLTWPDPDDWLAPKSIEERVSILEQNPEAGTVRCNAEMIDDKTQKSLGHFFEQSDLISLNDNLFHDLAHIQTYFAPVCYMVRSKCFLEVNPERSIYVSKNAGQNIQMLLPITYEYKSIQTNKVLSFYLVRENSFSRMLNTDADVFRWDSLMCDVVLKTLSQIKGLPCSYTSNLAQVFFRFKLIPSAFRARLKDETLSLIREVNFNFNYPNGILGYLIVFTRCSWISIFMNRLSMERFTKLEMRVMRLLLKDCKVVHSNSNLSK